MKRKISKSIEWHAIADYIIISYNKKRYDMRGHTNGNQMYTRYIIGIEFFYKYRNVCFVWLNTIDEESEFSLENKVIFFVVFCFSPPKSIHQCLSPNIIIEL